MSDTVVRVDYQSWITIETRARVVGQTWKSHQSGLMVGGPSLKKQEVCFEDWGHIVFATWMRVSEEIEYLLRLEKINM